MPVFNLSKATIAIAMTAAMASTAMANDVVIPTVSGQLKAKTQQKQLKANDVELAAVGFYYAGNVLSDVSKDAMAAFVIDGTISMNEALINSGVTNVEVRAAYLKLFDGNVDPSLAINVNQALTVFRQSEWENRSANLIPAGVGMQHLITKDLGSDNFYGMAKLGSNETRDQWSTQGYNYASVTEMTPTTSSVFGIAHELGHNFGINHNLEEANNTSTYAYGHGYLNCDGHGMSDLMSYGNPKKVYSSSTLSFDSHVCGDAATADGARVFREEGQAYALMNGRADLGLVTFNSASVVADEGDTVSVIINRTTGVSSAPSEAVWVAYRISHVTTTDADVSPVTKTEKLFWNGDLVDHTYSFGVVKFEAGQTQATITIPTNASAYATSTKEFDIELVGSIGVDYDHQAKRVTLNKVDVTPDAVQFTNSSSAELNAVITSNVVTISGLSKAVAISVAGGEYSIGCNGTFTSAASTISNTQTVCVRHNSSNQNNTSVTTTLTVGASSFTFTSTTKASTGGGGGGDSSGGGGGGSFGMLFGLAGLLAAARKKLK